MLSCSFSRTLISTSWHLCLLSLCLPSIMSMSCGHLFVLCYPFCCYNTLRLVVSPAPSVQSTMHTYGFAVVLFAVKPSSHSSWNYLVHVGLHLGVSIMVFCYVMEFHARSKCPKEENAVNTFVPRFFECFFS